MAERHHDAVLVERGGDDLAVGGEDAGLLVGRGLTELGRQRVVGIDAGACDRADRADHRHEQPGGDDAHHRGGGHEAPEQPEETAGGAQTRGHEGQKNRRG